jgi:ribosomal protein L37E
MGFAAGKIYVSFSSHWRFERNALEQNVPFWFTREMGMSETVRDVQREFWRPPLSQPTAATNLAEACRRCGTEFMVGAAFCHICGAHRHRADLAPAANWTKYLGILRALEFGSVKTWFGLPLPSLCAFLFGIACMVVALSMVFVSVHDNSDFQAVQLWRIQWIMAACASFLAGILLRSRKPQS